MKVGGFFASGLDFLYNNRYSGISDRPKGQGMKLSGEYVGTMLESSFPMELEMLGGDPVHVDYVVCETATEDPGDGPVHQFKVNIGDQWFQVTVVEVLE